MGRIAQQEKAVGYCAGGVDSMKWVELNKLLMRMQEKDLLHMLEDEMEGKNRKTYILRIHKRYNILRAKRERREMKQPR
jgi:hypothetical protein